MTTYFVRKAGQASELRDNFPTLTEDRVWNVEDGCILWRWGSFQVFPKRLEINPAPAALLAANKPLARKLCQRIGVRVPLTFYTASEAQKHFATSGEPLLWRPNSHRAGQNMVVVSSADGVSDRAGGYWSLILGKQREFRVYVLFGRVIGVDEKVVPDPTQLAWNHAVGGKFTVLHWDKWPSMACWMSTKLAHEMQLHFGAFDLITSDGKVFMLEVNTSPAMTTAYKLGLLHKAVDWIESQVTINGDQLPDLFAPLPDMIKGYRNYIHPLHIKEG